MYMLCLFGLVFVTNRIKGQRLYVVETTPKTWTAARQQCERSSMQLAVLNSEADYEDAVTYIREKHPNLTDIWIGYKLKKKGINEHVWINGEDPKFNAWGQGEPNEIDIDSCVRLKRSASYKFADRACSSKFDFLCTATTEKGETTTTVVGTITEETKLTEENTCYCSCGRVGVWQNYDNYTFEKLKTILAPITEQLRKELLLNKTQLSSYKRRFVSQTDTRPSATKLGYFGVTFIIIVSAAIIFLDLTSFFGKRNAVVSV